MLELLEPVKQLKEENIQDDSQTANEVKHQEVQQDSSIPDEENRNSAQRPKKKLPDLPPAISAEIPMITHSEEVAEYCFPLTLKIKREAGNRSQKTYYDTTGKRGLLCILQHEENGWTQGNTRDKTALIKYFHNELNFIVKLCNTYQDMKVEVKQFNSDEIYCVLIFISGHGNETHIQLGNDWKEVHSLIKDFSNENIFEYIGVPKILILDACRGSGYSTTTPVRRTTKDTEALPASDSDCLVIRASTHGTMSNLQVYGSVALQRILRVFRANWKNDHLEEMLIDARNEVALWKYCDERQILEIQTTLLKRLQFVKSKTKWQDVSPAGSSDKN